MSSQTSSSGDSSPKSSLSEDDDDQSSPVRFGLFPLAFQLSPFPMSCVLSLGSQPENIRPTCPSFWREVKKSQRVRRSSWRRWDGSCRWNPLGRSSTLKSWGISPSLSNTHECSYSH